MHFFGITKEKQIKFLKIKFTKNYQGFINELNIEWFKFIATKIINSETIRAKKIINSQTLSRSLVRN